MAAEAEMEALKNHTSASEEQPNVAAVAPGRPGKGPPESTSKFVIKLILICAAILAVGVGICIALMFLMPNENLPKVWMCQNDPTKRLFTLNGTQYYFSKRQSTWAGGDRLCKTCGDEDEWWIPMSGGLASLENEQITRQILTMVNMTQVKDFWTSGTLSDQEWLWRNDNSSLVNQDWAGDISSIEPPLSCLNVEFEQGDGSGDDETVAAAAAVWKARDCNFPSHFLCQATCT